MRSRLAFSLVLLLGASKARAVTCRTDSFTMLAVNKVCGEKANLEQCGDYQHDFLNSCDEIISGAQETIKRLSPSGSLSPEDTVKLDGAKKDLDRARAALLDAKEAGLRLAEDDGGGMIPYFKMIADGDEGIVKHAGDAIARIDKEPDPMAGQAAPTDATKAELLKSAGRIANGNAVTPDDAAKAAELYLAAEDPKDADRLALQLVASAPKDARGPSLLARSALTQHRPADAERWAQKALVLDPRDKKAQDALSFARSELSAQRLKKPAVGTFQEAREQDLARGIAGTTPRPRTRVAPDPAAPAGPVDPVPRALAGLLRRGYEKLRMDDLPGALADVSVHLDSHPDDAEARLIRAEILLKLGKPAPALSDIDLALAKAPDDPRALRARAAALYELGGRDAEALTAVERALALEPASGVGHLTRARILERLDRIPEAIAEYRAAAQLDPALEPIAEAALRRLGAAAPASKAVEKGLLRGGFLVVSLALILMGLVGGAVVATRRARTAEAAAVAKERTLKTGDLVAGQYRIARELGRGGMGVVFEAVDEKLKRPVALKQLQGDYRASAEDAARFLQEARLVAQLRHPNVAEIYAAVEDGGLFLVFELVRGRSLDAAIGAGLSPEQARGIVAHACAALTAAHARRIVHRDLKPSNMMISDAGEVKIMDFGIAHQSTGGGAFTQTSASGTPPYMAPEQAMGSVSSASDLYALGVMTYELLAGARPFGGPDFLGPKLRGEFAPVTSLKPALPASLDAFFDSALSPFPDKRPRDAAAFAAAFSACWS